jgi:hypothetical protein
MIKLLVRLALSSEYTRHPIRRSDISAKVLGTQTRAFKPVFEGAQFALRTTFGMEMVELPSKEKVTMIDRRKAQKSGAASANNTSSKSWLLRSMLPEKYRTAEILPPAKVPTIENEAQYSGLYSFVVATIMLAGGRLPEGKLERYLIRMNASQSTPVGTKELLMKRMETEGYIQKVKETNAGEDTIEYLVGPRGKMEIGEDGIRGFVKKVYGDDFDEDTGKRLERSLKMVAAFQVKTSADAGDGDGARKKGRGRPKRNAAADGEEGGNGGSDEE